MSRSAYSDVDQWDLIRWRGAVKSAIRGKRGQSFLREMAEALDAMPVRRLIAHEIVTPEGECCAMGAVALRRGVDVSDVDPEDSERVSELFGIADAMAREIAFTNDEAFFGNETPEQRWVRVRSWVQRNLSDTEDS